MGRAKKGKTRTMTEEHKAKLLEGRLKKSGLVNFNQTVRRRRQDGEVPSARLAIVNQCRECSGWESDEYSSLKQKVAACPATKCWLWPWRIGALNPEELEK